jgi:hypothetical protein
LALHTVDYRNVRFFFISEYSDKVLVSYLVMMYSEREMSFVFILSLILERNLEIDTISSLDLPEKIYPRT